MSAAGAGDWSEGALLGRDTGPLPRSSHPGLDLVLLDRDGTLNVHRPGYVADPADLVLLPEAAQAVRLLNDAGVPVVLVTNQQGIATGYLTEAQLVAVHRRLVRDLARAGARLDGIQLCPHRAGTCACRKPLPGMIHAALERAPWARAQRCVLVGDQPSDAAAADAAGVPCRLVGPGGSGLLDTVRQICAAM